MYVSRYVCVCVCVCVCLLDYSNNYGHIWMKYFGWVGLVPGTKCLDSDASRSVKLLKDMYSRLYKVSFIRHVAGLVLTAVCPVSALLVTAIIIIIVGVYSNINLCSVFKVWNLCWENGSIWQDPLKTYARLLYFCMSLKHWPVSCYLRHLHHCNTEWSTLMFHKPHFNSHFSGKPGLASSPFILCLHLSLFWATWASSSDTPRSVYRWQKMHLRTVFWAGINNFNRFQYYISI